MLRQVRSAKPAPGSPCVRLAASSALAGALARCWSAKPAAPH